MGGVATLKINALNIFSMKFKKKIKANEKLGTP